MVGLLGILGETHCGGGRGDSDFLVAPRLKGPDSNQTQTVITQSLIL